MTQVAKMERYEAYNDCGGIGFQGNRIFVPLACNHTQCTSAFQGLEKVCVTCTRTIFLRTYTNCTGFVRFLQTGTKVVLLRVTYISSRGPESADAMTMASPCLCNL